jgi:HK97 gp10 family phage protein
VARKNTQFSRLGRRNETFQVDGIDDVATALAEMGQEGRKRAMTSGFKEGAEFILGDMRRRVNDDKGLANNLTYKINLRKGTVTSADIGPRTARKFFWWSSRARWREFGTRDSAKKGGRILPIGKKQGEQGSWSRAGRHGQTYKALGLPWGPYASARHRGQSGKPFMRPTIDQNVAKIAEIVLDAIRVHAKRIGFTVR